MRWLGPCAMFLLAAAPLAAAARPLVVHAFVALCDNASQGIQPVPARIGDGDDPAANLYWGCDEGLKSHFSRSPQWLRVAAIRNPSSAILERCVFKHRGRDAWLVADAWRGREIQPATAAFLSAATGAGRPTTSTIAVLDAGETVTLALGSGADLLAYIGHNGLMDFDAPTLPAPDDRNRPCIVLCCRSEAYFGDLLRSGGARPLLTTTQLMYPGSFLLHDALEGWLLGEGGAQLRERAATAYARNQDISLKASRGVFAEGK